MIDNKEYASQLRKNAVKDENGVIRVSPELWEEVARIIENSEEVKHGEWNFVLETINKRVFKCSCCNYIRKLSHGETVPDLCEKCGAKMDGRSDT